MNFILQPWQLLFVVFCGWVHRRQMEIIEFQAAEIRFLLDKFGSKNILLSGDQRRLLAVQAHAIGRKALLELTIIFKPDTIAFRVCWPTASYTSQFSEG
jgi:hypothetical protein